MKKLAKLISVIACVFLFISGTCINASASNDNLNDHVTLAIRISATLDGNAFLYNPSTGSYVDQVKIDELVTRSELQNVEDFDDEIITWFSGDNTSGWQYYVKIDIYRTGTRELLRTDTYATGLYVYGRDMSGSPRTVRQNTSFWYPSMNGSYKFTYFGIYTGKALEPELDLQASADGGTSYMAGDTVTFRYKVTNNGNAAAENVVVSDTMTGLNQNIGTLAAGESREITASYTVKDSDSGNITNTVTAACGDQKKTDTVTIYVGQDHTQRDIKLQVFLYSNPSDGESFQPGDQIVWQIVLDNKSNTSLNNVKLTDTLTGLSESIDSFELVGHAVYTCTYTVGEDDAGTMNNTFTVTADDTATKTQTVSFTVANPEEEQEQPDISVTIEPTPTSEDHPAFYPGETITWKITVYNNGDGDAHNVVVTDTLTGLQERIEVLPAYQSEEFTREYVVTRADAAGSTVANAVTVTADGDYTAADTAVANVTGLVKLAVNAEETSTPADENGYQEGETVTWHVTVTNTGDASVIDLYLNGENDEQLYHTDQLKMDDSFELDVQHVVTAEDVQAGTVSIPLTITGENMDDESHVLEAAAYAEPADSTAEPTETPDDEQPTETPAEDQPAETAEPSASAEPAETPAATAQPQQQLPVTNAAPTAEPAATAVSVQTAAAQTPKTGVTGVTRWVILLGVCAGCLYLLNKKKH